jgi:hypothetical protein
VTEALLIPAGNKANLRGGCRAGFEGHIHTLVLQTRGAHALSHSSAAR